MIEENETYEESLNRRHAETSMAVQMFGMVNDFDLSPIERRKRWIQYQNLADIFSAVDQELDSYVRGKYETK